MRSPCPQNLNGSIYRISNSRYCRGKRGVVIAISFAASLYRSAKAVVRSKIDGVENRRFQRRQGARRPCHEVPNRQTSRRQIIILSAQVIVPPDQVSSFSPGNDRRLTRSIGPCLSAASRNTSIPSTRCRASRAFLRNNGTFQRRFR